MTVYVNQGVRFIGNVALANGTVSNCDTMVLSLLTPVLLKG
jgi:hypothetical protein